MWKLFQYLSAWLWAFNVCIPIVYGTRSPAIMHTVCHLLMNFSFNSPNAWIAAPTGNKGNSRRSGCIKNPASSIAGNAVSEIAKPFVSIFMTFPIIFILLSLFSLFHTNIAGDYFFATNKPDNVLFSQWLLTGIRWE
jgi:hypothetical protein